MPKTMSKKKTKDDGEAKIVLSFSQAEAVAIEKGLRAVSEGHARNAASILKFNAAWGDDWPDSRKLAIAAAGRMSKAIDKVA